jgi:hypothetical protein
LQYTTFPHQGLNESEVVMGYFYASKALGAILEPLRHLEFAQHTFWPRDNWCFVSSFSQVPFELQIFWGILVHWVILPAPLIFLCDKPHKFCVLNRSLRFVWFSTVNLCWFVWRKICVTKMVRILQLFSFSWKRSKKKQVAQSMDIEMIFTCHIWNMGEVLV